MLAKKDARHIIDLNPYEAIDKEIADRQFEVIVKGFNYLSQEENNFLYIADEVGLGKTYIALGIAALLRRFCAAERRGFYKDVVFVPKRNLQYKWVREINNFITHNYLTECNVVKSVLGSPVGECSDDNIHHQLDLFDLDHPSYEVYRNSSFSIATSSNIDWELNLENEIPESLKHIFRKGREIYTSEEDKIYLKRLYAFLLNISFPEIDFLIVDEAHNFKHGIGDGVAIRNQVVSRLMGVITEEDRLKIFSRIPELDIDRITPKAKKVIFLSATPIDNGLHELKQQFDCFLPNHRFTESTNISDDIKSALSSFMIRGLMNIKLHSEEANDGRVSRNMYRHEHRRGNVEKTKNAQPQYIQDDLESIIIGLMQYKTLKHFNESNNRSFEIGMLASFETFNAKTNADQEYEETANRSTVKSADQDVIQNIAESYFENFKTHLPHPKQDNMIEVLFNGIRNQSKSLVFVRRIASVVELERKLNHKIEEWQFDKVRKYVNKSPRLKSLKKSFEERHQIIEIEKLIENLSTKVLHGNITFFSNLVDEETNLQRLIAEYLIILYHSEEESDDLELFRALVLNHVGRTKIQTELKEIAYHLVVGFIEAQNELNSKEKEDQFPELQEDAMTYFFSSYFSSKRYIEGFNFRKRFGTKDWYKFNYYYLKDIGDQFQFRTFRLIDIQFTDKEKTEARRMEAINERVLESLEGNQNDMRISNFDEVNEIFKKKTFFNQLLEGPLKTEYDKWVEFKLSNPSKGYSFIEDHEALIEIFQGIFRNGSGLLPAYIAESIDSNNFEKVMIDVLESSFPEVISELKQIIIDFDKIMSTNFGDRNKIQRALYGQYPVTGASGFHKRDVSRVATQFRMPGYPYVLITTDVLKEGEDLHLYCKDVYHYGIAWNPSDMEQRTGRIDRINSSCYFELKKDGKRSFDNSLQVFYPYLADTLEVNQVAKVFNKMNDFIQTFYDISVIRDKDSKASTDDIVKEIPKQIQDLLSSKYDHDKWPDFEGESLVNIEPIGLTKAQLNAALQKTFELIKSSFPEFFIPPYVKVDAKLIRANVNLEGRRAPLKITLIQGGVYNQIQMAVDSIIGRSSSNDLRERKTRIEIREYLQEKEMELVENNDFLLVRKRMNINESQQGQFETIRSVLVTADELEEQYTGGDEDGF